MIRLLPLLAAADDNAFLKITRDFGINLPSILAQMLSFAVVAYVLWHFAFKPVTAALDERQKKIADGLRYADEMKAKLEETQKQTDQRIHEAQVEGQRLVDEARKAAKEFADRQQKDAIEKANALIEKAQAAIELEKRKMLAEARTEIARLVVVTTQQVLGRELPEAERARYNEAAARELSQV